jgi:hypothetical protein
MPFNRGAIKVKLRALPGAWHLSLVAAALFSCPLISGSEFITYPFRGVTLIKRTETSPRANTMHVVKIDLAAPGIRFKLSPPGGARETILQTTLDFLIQERAQLAVNAHFYLPYPPVDAHAVVVGFAASEGTIYSTFEPQPIGIGYPDQSYAILPYAPALNLDRSNNVTILHHDPTRLDNGFVPDKVTVWTALSGSAQIVSNGLKAIPLYSGSPTGLNPIGIYSETNSWYFTLHARTAIGLTADRKTLVLFAVDVAGGSLGMTVHEVADLLIHDYSVDFALNLDGGGSTTMAMEDPISRAARLLTTPSDTLLGRAVGSSLAVFAQPTPERVMPLNIALNSDMIVLSWPKTAFRWTLQSSSQMDADDWKNLAVEAQLVEDRFEVILRHSGPPRYYRLIQN